MPDQPLPDRELDARLAEALGWERWTCSDFAFKESTLFAPGTSMKTWAKCGPSIPFSEFGTVLCPCYSSDIRAAFDLVEEMRDRGWTLFMNGQRSTPLVVGSDCWHAAFWRLGQDESVRVDGSPTPARAIAEAALAALEAK